MAPTCRAPPRVFGIYPVQYTQLQLLNLVTSIDEHQTDRVDCELTSLLLFPSTHLLLFVLFSFPLLLSSSFFPSPKTTKPQKISPKPGNLVQRPIIPPTNITIRMKEGKNTSHRTRMQRRDFNLADFNKNTA